MRRYFIILIIFILHHCTINEIQSGAEKNLISSYKGYSFDEYVKLFLFTVSAVLAGIAGALYVPQVGIINPGEFSPINSIVIVIWVAVGGRGTLYGAVIGAILVNYAKTFFTAFAPEIWLFALGGLFVFVTVFLPTGIVGFIKEKKLNRFFLLTKS